MRIASLNTQNMRLLPNRELGRLHGAWDSDDPEDPRLDPIDRRLTADLLAGIDADLVALQEVFDLATLEHFHARYLLPTGTRPYPERVCLPGNDGRGLDLAVLSRRKLGAVRSHAALTPGDLGLELPEGVDPEMPIFRRDCLMVEVGALTLFITHFKSPYPDEATAWRTRHLEALATRALIEKHFDDPAEALWLILGDLNEPDDSELPLPRATAPLEHGFSVDLMARIPRPERWTYYDPHSARYHCPDVLLASRALAARYPDAVPRILRKGLGTEAASYQGERLPGIGRHRPHASDHAAVAIDLPGL
ncbi:endonuclease/exonuclease/phosphatase family protein [Thioclava sp. NG1]|uniref:endonuclease/exonuclease/phosphatase family protein n=1 Tax=Thioclava sp. NG1 TaxID=2182426 RepID=UPI000D614DC6|nr:endonuclease/exonuclease/phosphatase family protein [Thioclava sp. NG1]PWE48226.1 endonuclease/exonuclease/phosphatase family protein [Thioclava sp. NG1]